MNIVLHDAGTNDYLTRMYWEPLCSFMPQIKRVKSTDGIRDSLVIAHGDCLTPERILRLKNDGNKVCSFDINDSSYLSKAYARLPAQQEIDLIFKVSGVPKRNEIAETSIDGNFKILTSREKFLPDDQWAEFEKLRPRIKPLPYVLWHPLTPPQAPVVPFEQRSGKVLLRGGNHFWRVILAFRLMQDGLLDERSEFATAARFTPEMEQRFQFCDACKSEKGERGCTPYEPESRPEGCTSPVSKWGQDGSFFGGPVFGKQEFGKWNNCCPRSYLWLARQFEARRGPLNAEFLEKLFNGDMRQTEDFAQDLGSASFAGDFKWLNTINLPPRFWEAASLGTPSLYAARTADQDYWPHVEAGVHYATFSEDMLKFDIRGIRSNIWSDMSRAVKDLYETKIRGTDHSISNALLRYMAENIENIL